MIKYFRFSYDYAVWDIGYTNLIMLLAAIPDFDTDKEEKKKEVIDFGDNVQSLANYINNHQ